MVKPNQTAIIKALTPLELAGKVLNVRNRKICSKCKCSGVRFPETASYVLYMLGTQAFLAFAQLSRDDVRCFPGGSGFHSLKDMAVGEVLAICLRWRGEVLHTICVGK